MQCVFCTGDARQWRNFWNRKAVPEDTFKTDTLFKVLFVRHRDLLRQLGGTEINFALTSTPAAASRSP